MTVVRTTRVVLMGLAIVLVSACASTSTETSDTTTRSTASTSGGADSSDSSVNTTEVSSGGVLRVVVPTEPATMDPVRSVISDARVWGTVMEPLVASDSNGAIVDTGLITSWERPSATEWLFTLQEGVEFHNGEPFDAEAVKQTINSYLADEETRSGSFLRVVTDMTVNADGSLTVTTENPYGPLPEVLAQIYAIPPRYYADVGSEEFAQAPVGTGPFVFGSLQPGQQVSVVRNSGYWRGPPLLDEIQFTFSGDAQSRVALLESGAADIALDVPVESVDAIDESDATQIASAASTSLMTLIFEIDSEPFNEFDLRRAAAEAVDAEILVDTIFDGRGASVSNYFTGDLMDPPGPGWTGSYDPDSSRTVLDGLGDAPEITLTYTTGSYSKDTEVGEAIAGMFEAVGFVVERNPLDVTQMLEMRSQNTLDAYIYRVVPVYPSADVYTRYFMGTDSAVPLCASPEIDDMKGDLAVAEDDATVLDLYARLEDATLNDEVCLLPLFNPVAIYGLAADVSGFVAPRNHLPDWTAISVGS